MSDEQIVAKIQSGSVESYALLYDRYFDKIYKFIYFRTHHMQNAEDLVGQTFLKGYEKLLSFDSSKGSFSSWIYKIAYNNLVDFWRLSKNKTEVDLLWAEHVSDSTDIEEGVDLLILSENVKKIIENLPDIEKRLLTMRVWDELPYSEISVILNKSEAALKMQFSRIIAKLRSSIIIKT